MTNRNTDSANLKRILKSKSKKLILVDAIYGPAIKPLHKQRLISRPVFNTVNVSAKTNRFLENFSLKKLPVFVAVFLVIFGFLGGIWATLKTSQTTAEEISNNPITETSSNIKVKENPADLGSVARVSNDVFFTLTVEQIEGYLREAVKTPEMKEAESLAIRKQKLLEYLKEKKSPFVEIVNVLAELRHWKMVLAISNSESTLGKRCYNNNCSGIGVEPGHPLWRDYSTKAEWAKDLDRLLEKRYKNWTLEKMNGVYNQPGSRNWVLAAKQILEDLEKRNIY